MSESKTKEFRVQYTNQARREILGLGEAVKAIVAQRITVIAMDPYAHGETDPTGGCVDRRIVSVANARICIWLSPDLLLLTVMSIRPEGYSEATPPETPPPPQPGSLPVPLPPPTLGTMNMPFLAQAVQGPQQEVERV